jgi:exodeoxyribonuclease VII large subunit
MERLRLHHPESWCKERLIDLQREARSLLDGMDRRMDRLRRRLEEASARMDSLSPLAVLGRGYSIVRKLPEGSLVHRGGSLVKGDEVDITFAEGGARCRVESPR